MINKQLWLAVACVAACSGSSAERARVGERVPQAADRVERIAHGLAPPVQVRGEEVRWAIADRMREHRIPAVSIAVFDNYELQWSKAYGVADVETGQRATERTLFLAGSISKSVNALAALLAAADGTLSLDAPINDALESWKLPDNELTRARPVTLRMLLSHSAGTTVHGFPGYVAGSALPTVPQILDGTPPANTAAVRVDLAPGTKFRYSGGGITIAQLALTERSKRPYPAILADRVLGPLGMEHSTYEQALSPEQLREAAAGHRSDGTLIPGKRNAYPEMAAAGLWTNPTDLARFFLEVARGRANRPSRVPNAIAMQMTTKAIADDDGDPVGLGVFVWEANGARFFGHNGSDEGFQANAVVSLDGGRGVVVMANSDNGFKIFEEITRAVFAEYGWPGGDAPVARVALDAAQRARFAGRFLVGDSPVEIGESGGQLMLARPFDKPVELVPIAPDVVVRRDDASRIRSDASGPIEVAQPHRPVRKVTRIASRHPLFEIEAGHFDAAVTALREQLQADASHANDIERALNNLGYQVLARDSAKGIEVLRLVATVLPDSSNAHDSLGEAYMTAGDRPRAIAEYERALATLDADPRLPPDARRTLRTHAEAQLAKLRAP